MVVFNKKGGSFINITRCAITILFIIIFIFSCKKTATVGPTDSTNTIPSASYTVNPTTGTTATTFTFDASGSTDNEDETSVLQVRWDWESDGTFDTNFSTSKTESHQYSTAGTYTVLLEVQDTGGLTNTTDITFSVQQQSIVVTFPDANFEILIREVLNKPNGDIDPADLLTITELDGEDRDIADISGIEYCTNLQKLNLMSNQIIEVNDLSSLTNLQELLLTSNDIIDISALGTLTNLTWLSLMDNHIINISVLNTLTNLQELALLKNLIVDISGLNTLTNLEWLSLGLNQIVEIDALSSLTNIRWLNLQNNQIVEIGALSSLMSLQWLSLQSNPLSETSINTIIPELEARGVTVNY